MQIGREDTPEQYIDRLTEVFRELRRVLRSDGTLWLNIADTYCGTGNKGYHADPKNPKGRNGQQIARNNRVSGCKQKDLIGIPWLLAFALRADGWYLRSDIIWQKEIAFVGRHPAGVCIAVAALLLFIMVSAGLSSCGSMFSGLMNGILGTSYTSEDSDLVATENNYAAKENELQQQIDNIESTHPGYDEYRYDLDSIGHNPHELASYLTALLQTYTPQSAQAELNRVFAMQYTLTLTEETEIRYRTETSTDPETGETTTEEVPYEYHILNVKLTNKPISEIAEELLTPQQLEMYRVYLETSGNKPLIFGGGSPDMGASEDLSGVQLVNGTRPGNTAVVDLAKRQVGNVGGRPFWSWYGFNSRVEWCACFVSWCYNQAGKSEPRFAGCQSQGVPWFQSRGQWGARGYENIAPGDAIFFDWDGDGSADHVGLVIGTDGERVYTVEGNSGDACKIKSYPVNYSCIKGYGLMNWN